MVDLFKIKLNAHSKYVGHKIEGKRDQYNYVTCMNIIDAFECESLDALLLRLQGYKAQRMCMKENWFNFFNSSKKYQIMAVDHALEIATGLKERFNTGWSKFYPFGFDE